MANSIVTYEDEDEQPGRNTARASIRFGKFEASAELDVTPRGLFAVGGMVSLILVSVVPIVVAATRKAPRRL
jgi:hypothetical protein